MFEHSSGERKESESKLAAIMYETLKRSLKVVLLNNYNHFIDKNELNTDLLYAEIIDAVDKLQEDGDIPNISNNEFDRVVKKLFREMVLTVAEDNEETNIAITQFLMSKSKQI
jgi:hypothetical protein